jgi:hypothetical protein
MPAVTSDRQAFEQILKRLQDDVGVMMKVIESVRDRPSLFDPAIWQGDAVPMFALVRMTFPIAESVGDLIYRSNSTVNLKNILSNQFEDIRSGYKGKAASLSTIYRHGLTHTDEMRTLAAAGKKLTWHLSWGNPSVHLTVSSPDKGARNVRRIHFDTSSFYCDLVKVCQNAMNSTWNGEVMERYNSWLDLDLDVVPNPNSTTKAAIVEINGF